MRIAVTGVAGFIGSNLAETLCARGHTLVGLDNLSQGSLANLATVLPVKNFTFHQADILDVDAISRHCANVDAVIHLAAFKIPRYSNALETLRINTRGSENVMAFCAERSIKFVFASTSDVYGMNPALPFAETSASVIGSPTVPRWSYAISKMYAEQMAFAFHEASKLDVTVLRFFGGYGPRQHPTWRGGPQAVFIEKALDREELPIHGDGLQTRTFTFVSDLVAGITAATEKDRASPEVINLGSTNEITITELARTIWRLVNDGETAPIRLIPYEAFGRYEDVRRRVPDLTKAKELLGYESQVKLEDGLKRTIAWHRQRRALLAHSGKKSA